MEVDVLFTGIAVSDFGVARSWYERFFGRAADVVAHDTEVMWQVTDRGWLYILEDAEHAGHGMAAMAVPNIDAATSELAARGVRTGPIEPEGDTARKSVVRDPDGNPIAVIEVAARG